MSFGRYATQLPRDEKVGCENKLLDDAFSQVPRPANQPAVAFNAYLLLMRLFECLFMCE